MELTDAIKARRSIRKFKPDPVPDSHIKEILEAARLAPSGINIQPWRFVVIKSDEAKRRLEKCTPLPFVARAPVIIACCADTQSMNTAGQRASELREAGAFSDTPLEDANGEGTSHRRLMDESETKAYLNLNVAIAIDHITLKAVDLGLGTCWVMMFDRAKINQVLDLEDRYNVVALIPVGYPEQQPGPRPRLGLQEIILKEV